MTYLKWALCFLHYPVELQQRWHKDTEREQNREQHTLGITMIKLCERYSGVWQYIAQYIGYCIINPMKYYPRHYAACAHIHPTQKQTTYEGMRHLSWIDMDKGKEKG